MFFLSPIIAGVGAFVALSEGDQSENMDALNRYINTIPILNPKAAEIRDEWNVWYSDLNWYDKVNDKNTYYIARNKKREFDLANVETSEEKKQVEEVYRNGARVEREIAAVQGESIPINSEGKFNVPLIRIPTQWKAVGALGVITAGSLWILSKIYLRR